LRACPPKGRAGGGGAQSVVREIDEMAESVIELLTDVNARVSMKRLQATLHGIILPPTGRITHHSTSKGQDSAAGALTAWINLCCSTFKLDLQRTTSTTP